MFLLWLLLLLLLLSCSGCFSQEKAIGHNCSCLICTVVPFTYFEG